MGKRGGFRKNRKGWIALKMTKEEFLGQIMTRREAENYVGLSSVAFQHHLRTGRIMPCKEHGEGKGKVQLFWINDLNKLKKFIQTC